MKVIKRAVTSGISLRVIPVGSHCWVLVLSERAVWTPSRVFEAANRAGTCTVIPINNLTIFALVLPPIGHAYQSLYGGHSRAAAVPDFPTLIFQSPFTSSALVHRTSNVGGGPLFFRSKRVLPTYSVSSLLLGRCGSSGASCKLADEISPISRPVPIPIINSGIPVLQLVLLPSHFSLHSEPFRRQSRTSNLFQSYLYPPTRVLPPGMM